jgi:hypothetical protein
MGLVNTLLHYYTGNPNRTAFSTAFAELTQPILRGFGAKNPQVENLTQAERNVIYRDSRLRLFPGPVRSRHRL